jgi:hypothetical protein
MPAGGLSLSGDTNACSGTAERSRAQYVLLWFIDLADVCDEIGLDTSRLRHEIRKPTEQLVVGNGRELEIEFEIGQNE